MKVFLDDRRPCPDGFVAARSAEQAIQYLKSGEVTELSLDYNLGTPPITGLDVVKYMVRNHVYPQTIVIHSSDPVGRRRMRKLLLAHKPAAVSVAIRRWRKWRKG